MSGVEAAQRQWMHDLNNAINTIGVTAAVINRMMASGDFDEAKDLVGELEAACDRCRELLGHAPANGG